METEIKGDLKGERTSMVSGEERAVGRAGTSDPENYVSYCLYMQITLFTFLITVEKYVRVIEPNEVN